MPTIAIIGAGQLGGRHLQAVLKLDVPLDVWVVDPAEGSLAVARTRAAEVAHGAAHGLTFTTSIGDLPGELDYVIVATGADVRLAVLESLLARARVRFLVLEKVLFQRVADYDRAARLIADHGVTAWVDCTRRVYPIYDRVKAFFAADPIWSFDVAGGAWGLGCNVVHFLDLYAHLSGEVVERIDTAGLDRELLQSRRPGFVEFAGTLTGFSRSARFAATSRPELAAPLLITIRSSKRTCILDEAGGTAFFGDHADRSWQRETFEMPFLSEASTGIARSILADGRSRLAGFAESAACHRPLIAALAAFAAAQTGGDPEFCPIT